MLELDSIYSWIFVWLSGCVISLLEVCEVLLGLFAYVAVAIISCLLFSIDFLGQNLRGDQFKFSIILFLVSIIVSFFVERSALSKVAGARLKLNFSADRVRFVTIKTVLLIVTFASVSWQINFVDLIDHMVYGLVIYFFVGALFESFRYLRSR